MGFQAWTAIASPVDEWPFSIRADGRPMDICAAILLGKLTGDVERLTLQQFSERLADAVWRAFHEEERAELLREIERGSKSRPCLPSSQSKNALRFASPFYKALMSRSKVVMRGDSDFLSVFNGSIKARFS